METVKLKIGEVTPYEKNAKKHDEKQIKNVMESIRQFGFVQPIVVDKNKVIIIGHCRFMAAKRLEMEEIDAVIADQLTDEQVSKLRLLDNKLNESEWDIDLLMDEVPELNWNGFDVDWGIPDIDDIETEEQELERKKKEFEERMAAGELSEDSEEYQEFLAKFEAKKTTDDCYTPPMVYDAVADYVAGKYKLKKTQFVRPFVPGGDYINFQYPENGVVVDNPPFSILAEILQFYKNNGIKFFLFAPALTLFSSSSSSSSSSTALCTGIGITYENGARVNTSFLTNLDPAEIRFRTAPDLYAAVKIADEENAKKNRKELPKYSYPLEVVTAPMLTAYSRYGIDFAVNKTESYQISSLDSQKASGKALFGKGYLISNAKKAEREKAEREKAERWELSEREIEIISRLG